MLTIGLVHGGYHGAWCWDLVIRECAERGVTAIAADLPIADAAAAASEYADAVVRSLSSVSGDVVLVGHSMGGLVIPIVAVRRPVRQMVFLAAEPPTPGRSMADYLSAHPDVLSAPPDSVPLIDSLVDPPDAKLAIDLFYHDCPPEVASWAARQLRPQGSAILTEPCPLDEWPAVGSTSVVCADDRAVNPDGYRRMVRDVLGIEPAELRGSHSPFLARPGELTDLLLSMIP